MPIVNRVADLHADLAAVAVGLLLETSGKSELLRVTLVLDGHLSRGLATGLELGAEHAGRNERQREGRNGHSAEELHGSYTREGTEQGVLRLPFMNVSASPTRPTLAGHAESGLRTLCMEAARPDHVG